MKATTQKRIINRLLAAPAVQWEDQVTRLLDRNKPFDLQPLIDTCNGMAEQLAWLAEYVEFRTHGHTHAKASKSAQRRQIKVSRALGYSYPERRAYLS